MDMGRSLARKLQNAICGGPFYIPTNESLQRRLVVTITITVKTKFSFMPRSTWNIFGYFRA